MRLPCVPFGVKTGRPGTQTFWNTSSRQALAASFQQLTVGMTPSLLRHLSGVRQTAASRLQLKCNRWKKVGDDEFSRRRCATPGATLISKSGNSSCQSNCDW